MRLLEAQVGESTHLFLSKFSSFERVCLDTGQLLVQMAKVCGAKVIGTSSASKFDVARNAGVDHVIDYYNQDVVKEVGCFFCFFFFCC
jgi:hypothetical protein